MTRTQLENVKIYAREILEGIGYDLSGEVDVHSQFMLKYKEQMESKPKRYRRPHTKNRPKKNISK